MKKTLILFTLMSIIYINFTENIYSKNLEIPINITYDKAFYTPMYQRYYDINKTTYISKIPIQLLGLYSEFINTKYETLIQEEKGENYIPTNEEKLTFLSILLAMHHTESRFNANAQTNDGNAVGLGQLYKPTAKWLLKVNPDKFSKYFMLENNQITYLYTSIDYTFQTVEQNNKLSNWDLGIIRSQILTSAEILINYKKYNPDEPFNGIKKYNGGGERATNYAILVLKRSVLYQLWIMENTSFTMPKTTENYNQLIHDILYNNVELFKIVIGNTTFYDDNNTVKLILNDVENSLTYNIVKNTNTRYFKYTIGTKNIENIPNLTIEQSSTIYLNDFVALDSKNCETYLNIYFRRRSIFSYFYNLVDMVETFELPINKDNGFYVYYIENSKRVKLEDKFDLPKFKNKTLFINIQQNAIQNKNLTSIAQCFTIIIPKGIIVRIEDNTKELSINCN